MKTRSSTHPLLGAALAFALTFAPDALAFKSCLANIEGSRRLDGTSFRHTWAPLPEASGATTAATLKNVLAAAGFSLVGEQQESDRTMLRASRSVGDWQGAAIEFTTDGGLGIVSVNAVFPERGMAVLEFESVICATLEAAFPTGEPLPQTGGLRASTRAKKAQAFKALVAAQSTLDLDRLYNQALTSGHAILVIPALNVDAKYIGTDAQDKPVEFWQDISSTTRWNRAEGGPQLRVGHNTNSSEIGMPGFHHSFVVENKRYLVYIIDPGTYRLDGFTIDLKRTTLPQVHPANGTAKLRVGTVYLQPGKYEDYYREQEWRNAQFEERKVAHNYCSLTIVGGPCVQWSNYNETYMDMVKQAGYENVVKTYMADLLQVDATLSTPFASFVAKPGEAVVVDGFYGQHPSLSFDVNRCEPEKSGVRCDMTEIVFVRIPGNVEDLASPSAIQVTESFPNLRRIFGTATHSKPEITAKADALVPGLGQLYGVGVRR